jgi:hypothetical protein
VTVSVVQREIREARCDWCGVTVEAVEVKGTTTLTFTQPSWLGGAVSSTAVPRLVDGLSPVYAPPSSWLRFVDPTHPFDRSTVEDLCPGCTAKLHGAIETLRPT